MQYSRTIDRKHVDTLIGDLTPGEVAYCQPWALWVDLSLTMWLHPMMAARTEPNKAFSMRIERHEEFMVVDIPEGTRKFEPVHQPGMAQGQQEIPWIPAARRVEE